MKAKKHRHHVSIWQKSTNHRSGDYRLVLILSHAMLVLVCPTVRVIPVTAVAVVDKTEILPLKLTLGLTLERLEAAVFRKH